MSVLLNFNFRDNSTERALYCIGVVEGSSVPLPKIMIDFGGELSPLLRTSFKLDKFIITHFPKEKKGKVRLYQQKQSATSPYSLSPSRNTFICPGLTSTLLSYMQKWARLEAWSSYFLQYSPPCYSFRMAPQLYCHSRCRMLHMKSVQKINICKNLPDHSL